MMLPGRSHWDLVIPAPTQEELNLVERLYVGRELYGMAWCNLPPGPSKVYAVLLMRWGDWNEHQELESLAQQWWTCACGWTGPHTEMSAYEHLGGQRVCPDCGASGGLVRSLGRR